MVVLYSLTIYDAKVTLRYKSNKMLENSQNWPELTFLLLLWHDMIPILYSPLVRGTIEMN